MNAAGESEVDSDSDQDLIKSLEADFQLEDKSQDKINPQLATAINNVWKLKLIKEKIKEGLQSPKKILRQREILPESSISDVYGNMVNFRP